MRSSARLVIIAVAAVVFGWQKEAIAQCALPHAPAIAVTPVSNPIEYDFERSEAALSAVKSDTKSPYAPGTDTATGGLRHDEPKISTAVKIGQQSFSDGSGCLWYDEIKIDITLQPKIYVARENDGPRCRDAIIEHEHKHVDVDRLVINKHSKMLGDRLRGLVNNVGASGPYQGEAAMKEAQEKMVALVEKTIAQQTEAIEQEMRQAQAQIDTLAEYQAVSMKCPKNRKKEQ